MLVGRPRKGGGERQGAGNRGGERAAAAARCSVPTMPVRWSVRSKLGRAFIVVII